jgi:hypothetical protein
MDLKEFVKETLIQISTGVRDAQAEVRKLGGLVNPATYSSGNAGGAYFASYKDGHHIFLVDFDVAVTVTENSATNAEAKLKVASLLSLGAGGSSSAQNEVTNRLSFKVPLAFPIDSESQAQLKAEADAQEALLRSYSG